MNNKEKQMFLVINSKTKQIRTFRGRPSEFPYRKVAEKYAAKENSEYAAIYALRHGYHDGSDLYVVMSEKEYYACGWGETTREVVNLMTGEVVKENINTPWSCSVASESYWSN